MSPARRLSLVPSLLAISLACGSPGQASKPTEAAAPARAHARAASRPAATPRAQDRLANYDARSAEAAKPSSLRAAAFSWETRKAAGAAAKAAAPTDAVSAARAHLGLAAPSAAARAAARTSTGLDEAVVAGLHDTGRGPVVVQFQRKVGGLEVFGERTALVMDRQLRPVARTGAAPAAARPAPALRPFALDARAAIAAALSDVAGEAYTTGDLAAAADQGGYARAGLAPATAAARGVRLLDPARARKVLFPLAAGLVPAWRVEVQLRGAEGLRAFAHVISAVDGAVLFRRNLVQDDAYAYRVWADPVSFVPYDGPQGTSPTPHPTGLPDLVVDVPVAQQLVSLQNAPFSQNDPWLPAAATETVGNNVWAYADWYETDDIATGYPGLASAPGSFDFGAYDFASEPWNPDSTFYGGIAQLFYDTNFLHDWYYDSGFDEAAGNAQDGNYGRGGVEGDPLHAEAFDSGGYFLDNANMMTPADGGSPRMQMYLWSGIGRRYVQVTAPAAIQGSYEAQVAQFGPTSFDVSGSVVAADPADGCAPLTNGDLTGKIAFIERGTCAFVTKVKVAQDAHASGVIIHNVSTAQAFGGMGGTDDTLTIPVELITIDAGAAIGGQLAASVPVTARLYREAALYRDGGIDNLIVAHEWGHYLSNRLIGDGSGLESNQSGGLGEGWGDTSALTLAVRAEDVDVVANAGWAGTYGLAGWVATGAGALGTGTDGYYFGVRRVPYSTDMQKDPLTFGMIADGRPLVPDGSTIPIAFGADGSDNSEVHNTGEVWATMLWECYAALLRDTTGDSPRLTFAQAQARWKDYLVASLKLTPMNPTLLEARDAVLAAAYATDARDYALFWQAFARRGAGAGAIGPARWSPDNNPVVESYDTVRLSLVSASFASTPGTCSDGDGIPDAGETGTLTIVLHNDGEAAIPAGTATPASSLSGLSFPGGAVTVPVLDRGASATVTLPLALAGSSKALGTDVVLTFPDSSSLAGASVKVPILLNQDEVAASSATATFLTSIDPWTVDGTVDDAPGWLRADHTYWGQDPDATSDLRLVSPELVVGADDFTVSVFHRYAFEAYHLTSGDYYFDGGVIELSDDGGVTWTDIGGDVYDGAVASCENPPGNPDTCGAPSLNPLAGRDAFRDMNASYPSYDSTDLDLGTAYAGKTVRIRFRIGSDEATGSGGWNIARVDVGGISNTPFPTLVQSAGRCASSAGKSSSGCSSGAGALSAAALLFLVAAFAFRLPRRRDGR
jgi:large repetitive protein